jgi:hypothetical protein
MWVIYLFVSGSFSGSSGCARDVCRFSAAWAILPMLRSMINYDPLKTPCRIVPYIRLAIARSASLPPYLDGAKHQDDAGKPG